MLLAAVLFVLVGLALFLNWRTQSAHNGGINVALADGSVRYVRFGIAQATWDAVLLPNDGKTGGDDW